MLLLITANLNSEKAKTSFSTAISGKASVWWHYIDNTWIVKTSDSIDTWNTYLRQSIDEVADSIFIIEVKGDNFNGWITKKAYEWIRNNRE